MIVIRFLRRFLAYALLAAALAPAVALGQALSLPRSELLVETASSQFRFEVEVADDATERAQGLMFRETLADTPACCSCTPRRRRSSSG